MITDIKAFSSIILTAIGFVFALLAVAIIVNVIWYEIKLKWQRSKPVTVGDLTDELRARYEAAEGYWFAQWYQKYKPCGNITEATRQWQESREFNDFCLEWENAVDLINRVDGRKS